MKKHTNSKLKKEIKVNDEMEFPDLSRPVVEKKVILDYKNMKEIEEQKEKVKEGWVKIYYKDNKIVKEYGKVPHIKIKKIKQEKNYQNEVQEVIKSMITRWEYEDKLKENEIDYYYYYYNENEYETEDEYELQEQDMNEELIEDLLNEDKF